MRRKRGKSGGVPPHIYPPYIPPYMLRACPAGRAALPWRLNAPGRPKNRPARSAPAACTPLRGGCLPAPSAPRARPKRAPSAPQARLVGAPRLRRLSPPLRGAPWGARCDPRGTDHKPMKYIQCAHPKRAKRPPDQSPAAWLRLSNLHRTSENIAT